MIHKPLAAQIDALLPQTQCRKCGFPGCAPYAEAISQGLADINRCPPGGKQGVAQLAVLMGVELKPLDPAYGLERPRLQAVIKEEDCTGCTKCIPPCPVNAIIGASKQMHTVIPQLCTGCELCVAPCPVNCISMEEAILPPWNNTDAEQARQRYRYKNERLARIEAEKAGRLHRQKQLLAQLHKSKSEL